MEQQTKNQTRKKFLLWGAAALSSIGILKYFRSPKTQKTETVKMLSQDGTLVEIDKSLLANATKKISNAELQQWVNKNNP
ncbi:hypothetical protein [Flavihumibacter profundi]|jgi:hypothetical protein|uniref:hypothetical protein n=1 Tax=Flavihumibacter profundi TaxID=2716883 RepID=UPI001CC3360E|nr:hypothetical protein [Flavihumibacter profundi]MBZ5858836.1 hypothetical protein [Flavihumibacter profundi]